jgi:SPP1 family predicted phage head-tail adaptor
MRILAGELRHRIIIQDYTETLGDIGNPVKTWTDTTTRWGKILPVSSREIIEGRQVEGRATHRVVLRYYDGLTRKSRLKYDGRLFNIEDIINIEERNKVHLIVATEVT